MLSVSPTHTQVAVLCNNRARPAGGNLQHVRAATQWCVPPKGHIRTVLPVPDRIWGSVVYTTMRRLGLLIGSMIALLLANPMAANAASQVSGDAAYPAGVQCPGPPAGYEDFVSYPGLL